MTSESLIFKGRVIVVGTGSKVTIKAYDDIEKLNSGPTIPPNEGYFAGVDAGAIIRDVITGSEFNLDSGGINITTGVIVDEIDLTDKTRLEAIKLLIHLVNGANTDDLIYHLYTKDGRIIFAPLPEYTNNTPAVILTDTEIRSVNIKEDGYKYFNCATCKGANGVRAYYPQSLDPEGNPIPNFPDEPSHYLIEDSSLIGVDACYSVARGYVRTHNVIPKEITVDFTPDRFDFFPGQTVRIDSIEHNLNEDFLIRDISGSYELTKTMSFVLSSVEVAKLSDFV